MFGPASPEEVDSLRPVAAMLGDEVQEEEVFADGPLAALDGGVEVVEPVLATLLGSLEAAALGAEEEGSGDLGPLAVEFGAAWGRGYVRQSCSSLSSCGSQ